MSLIQKIAKEVLQIEADAILNLMPTISGSFENAVTTILDCKGKVIVTGMGKSGLIGKKIASTLASTGTPAFFLHPAEAIHGDLGMIGNEDVVIALSNSGETEEILKILPVIKLIGSKIIAVSSSLNSNLGKAADIVLEVSVKKEACPLGLAPTASTTATLALGDAMAVALLTLRGFKEEDFAMYHPGGALGKKLLVRVSHIMHEKEAFPKISINAFGKDAIFEITSKKLGITAVLDDSNNLIGIITDGDLRRAMEKKLDILNSPVEDIMTKKPKTISYDDLAINALKKMEDNSITALCVVSDDKPVGIIHIHDILKAGITL